MASIERGKKSKGKSKAAKAKQDVESKIGSVISVKEAEDEDKANSVPQNEDEKIKKKSTSSEDEKGQADERSSESRPISAAIKSHPGTAAYPPSQSLSRPMSANLSPSAASTRPGSPSPSVTRKDASITSPELGSAVSLRSREAWSDRPGTSMSKGRPSTAKDNQDSLNKSIASLQQAEREINEHHAYVPYLYAKQCIARIVEDMKKMKSNHIRIVHDIEYNYKEIETESQSQFSSFVLSLRMQYVNKVKTFRQVIEVHRIELDQKQQYWDEALASLSKRNKVLLLDKKSLLVQNRVEFERLEKEKAETVRDLTQKLDESNSKVALIYKDNEENFEAERRKYEDEKKILQDQLDTEKEENEKLRLRIEEIEAVGAVVLATTEEKEVRDKNSKVKAFKKGQVATEALKREPTVVVTDMSEEDRRRMEEERRQMEEERQRMKEEREKMEQDRLKFEEDRKKFQEDRVVLQGDLTNAQKEAANWQGKYDALKDQLGELAALKANYDALKAQYDALAAVAVVQTVEDQKKADETIQKAQNDKDIMEEQKVMLEEDIKKWEQHFEKENGRRPEDTDKSEAVQEMETSLDEANNMIDSLDVKIDTMEKLKEGEVPKAPEVTAGPLVIPEPEVKIVEIKVPDPEIIAQLEMTQAELDALRKQVKALLNKTSGLQTDKSKLQGELAESSADVTKLDATVKALEEELAKLRAAGAADGVDPVEHARMKADLEKQLRETENDLKKQLENQENDYEERIRQLEKDKKGMERDIKKLIKAHQKLKAKMDAKDDHTKEIFPVVLQQVKDVHGLTPAAAEMVGDRLREAEAKKAKIKSEQEQAQKAYEAWEIGDRSNEEEGEKLKAELDEAKKNAKDLDHTIEALTMIKTGIVTKAKIDKTDAKATPVEKEALLEEGADAEDKVAELEDNITDLEGDKQMLEDKNKRLEEKLAELEEELEDARNKAGELGVTAAAAAATGSAASQEDIEALKRRIKELEELLRQRDAELEKEKKEKEEVEKERAELAEKNKEMEKDIKKMIKAYQKLKDKLKALQEKTGIESAPDAEALEEKITQLENQVIDLETDKDSLTDTNKKQDDKITKLEEELEEAKARSAELSGVAILAANTDDIEALKRAKAELKALLEQTKEQLEKETQQKQELEKKLETSEEDRREMEKDMKKMIKAYNKLKDKLAALQPGQQPTDAAAEADKLEDKVTKLENKIIDLESDNKNLDMSNKDKEDKLDELQRELDEAREKMAELSGVAATAVATEDVEALKRALADMENQLIQKEQQLDKAQQTIKELEDKVAEKEEERRDMEKDMKKLLKAHQKLKDKLAGLQDEVPKDLSKEDLEKKLSDLEDKVIELEADNKSLEDSKQDQDDKIERLEDDLEQAKNTAPMVGMAAALAGAGSHLREEKQSHDMCHEELEALRKQVVALKADLEEANSDTEAKVKGATSKMQAEIDNLTRALETSKARVNELEKARLANVPVDAQKEIKDLHKKLDSAEKERDQALKNKAGLEGQVAELKAKVASLEKTTKSLRQEVADLQNKARVGGRAGGRPTTSGKVDPKSDKALQVAQEKLQDLRRENAELKQRIRELESEAKRNRSGTAGGEAADPKMMKRHEKILKELEKKLEIETNKAAKNEENLKKKEAELKDANKDNRVKEEEISKLKAELSSLGVAAKEGVEAAQKVKALEKENKKLADENKQLGDNFNSERVLRKKYYNMVEDMKGKIRVYCRARPMSKSELDRGNHSVLKSPDEYTCIVNAQRGAKEFQFDQVFMPEHSQEKVFEDTNNLVQTAVDGYNVCIFAYGQTGSGKTYTMIGDKEQSNPGIAPRAFNRIFEVMQENKAKFKFKITSYMLELYNDKLLDLYAKPGTSSDEKLEIKKDKKGLVFVQGAEIKGASNAKEMFALFEEGSKNRHTASTKMNADSSRSHLVLAITIESTNKTSGQVLKGKLSLVDLAGSERAAKTEASAEQLKEAMSINKSLSALGDVISALSSEQSFIPYRNNKLTMLMQDSLGGNAKTLMFVNISPADYNTEESVVSLTYASRVKLITNDASKNADNKEIARLKAVIQKMKKGDKADEEVDED